jgi:hypothetical protein
MKKKSTQTYSFFNHLTNIINTKDKILMDKHINDGSFEKQFTQFMIIRYLSMCKKYQGIVMEEQQFWNKMSSENLYRYLFKRLPKGPPFIKYIKPDKKETK